MPEREFLDSIMLEIMKIYERVFTSEETIRRMDLVSPGKEVLAATIKAYTRRNTQIELPEPPSEHFEWVIERTAEILKDKIYLTAKVIHDLGLELQ